MSTEKPRPASTFLEKLAEKLTKKRDGEMVADEDVVKESGTRKSGSMKVKGKLGKKGKKPSKFGATSFMSEESSSEDDEEQEEGLEEELKTNNLKDRIKEASHADILIGASVGNHPVEGNQSEKEKTLNQKKVLVSVPGITASSTTQVSPSPYSAASSILKAASSAATLTFSDASLPSPRALPSSPGSPARMRLVVPVTGPLSRLPTNLVPCAPPPHLRMRGPSGSPIRSPMRPLSSIPVGSPRAANLVPCSPPNLKSPVTASSTASLLPSLPRPTCISSSLPATPSVQFRQKALKEEKSPQQTSKSFVSAPKTFTRRPKSGTLAGYSDPKALMGRRTGLGIDASQDKDVCIDLPTLSLTNYEQELPGFDTVLKLGSGATESTPAPVIQSDEDTNDCEVLENSVVFHVANQAMITQPTGGDNLEVKEQGSTRVLLTASSTQIEVHDLKEAVNRSYQQHQRRQGGAAQPLPDGGIGMADKHGRGWFQWKDWRVDDPFINGFSSYMQTLVTKWRHQLQPEMDSKISALLKERESGGSRPEVMQKIIVFFAEVFVKFLFIRSNFPAVSMDSLIDVLRRFHAMDNTKFSLECNPGQSVHILLTPPQERRTITVVRPADMTEQAKVAALAKQNLTPVTASGSRYATPPAAHQTNSTRALDCKSTSRSTGFAARSPLSSVPNLSHQGKKLSD